MKKIILLFVFSMCVVVRADQWVPVDELGSAMRFKTLTFSGRALDRLAFSSDGRHVAYVRDWTSIWISESDGENERKVVDLTDSLNIVANPHWSPDGKYLVYSAGVGHGAKGGKTSIWRVNISDLEREQLFINHSFPSCWDTFASWSPDGSKIATNAQGNDGERLLVLDLSRNAVTEIPGNPKTSGRPQWTADGQQILVPGEDHDRGNLWLISLTDGVKKTVDTNQLQATSASFSPDGQYLLFQVGNGPDNSNYIISAAGGKPIAVPGNELNNYSIKTLVWSRDGTSIIANNVVPVPWWMDSRTILAVVDTSGANFKVLVERDEPLGMPFQRLAWSPDEEQLAYTLATKEDTAVYSVDLKTLESTKITQGKNPTWSPYMDEIAFSRNGNIWVQNVETEIESQVTLNLDNADQPQWSPTGDLICFGNGSPWGLWLVSALGGEPTLLTQKEGVGQFNWSADGTRGWGHNPSSNEYNGIWGDTWEYALADAPNAGVTWGGCEGHFARVAPDGSYVYSFHGFQGEGIIIQKPSEQTGRVIFTKYRDLMPTALQASPSGTRIAFLLMEPFRSETWKIDVSGLLTDSVDP